MDYYPLAEAGLARREILAEELQLDALDGEEGQKVLGIDLKTLRRSSFLSRALSLYVRTFVSMYIRMSVYACMYMRHTQLHVHETYTIMNVRTYSDTHTHTHTATHTHTHSLSLSHHSAWGKRRRVKQNPPPRIIDTKPELNAGKQAQPAVVETSSASYSDYVATSAPSATATP